MYRWNLGTEINVETITEAVQQRVSSDDHHAVVQTLHRKQRNIDGAQKTRTA